MFNIGKLQSTTIFKIEDADIFVIFPEHSGQKKVKKLSKSGIVYFSTTAHVVSFWQAIQNIISIKLIAIIFGMLFISEILVNYFDDSLVRMI